MANRRSTISISLFVCFAFSFLLSSTRSFPHVLDSATHTSDSASNEDVRSLEFAVAAAAYAEAAEGRAEFEVAMKVLAATRLRAEALRADLSAARHQAEVAKRERAAVHVDAARMAERASNRSADLKRAEEFLAQAVAFAAEKRRAVDEAAAAVGEAARAAGTTRSVEAKLALWWAENERAELAQVVAVAEKLAEAAKQGADEIREVYARAENQRKIAAAELDSEQLHAEKLESAVARMEEEHRQGVIALKAAEAKVTELKALAEGRVARTITIRVAYEEGGTGNSRVGTTATI
ncbi:unnamed protein product [Closterium sp. Yama58-4]|nr:unnamed protein product [Closterium sp. Yama58-4]